MNGYIPKCKPVVGKCEVENLLRRQRAVSFTILQTNVHIRTCINVYMDDITSGHVTYRPKRESEEGDEERGAVPARYAVNQQTSFAYI